MNLEAAKISLAHVHAYVDGQLDDDGCERLEEYFDSEPDKFDQLQQFLAINDHYQSLCEPVLHEPIPQSMLERIYAENVDSFQSPNSGYQRVLATISSLLFDKPSVWLNSLGKRFYSFLRINRLENQLWYTKLRSAIGVVQGHEEGNFIKLTKSLKLHPQTAPAWMNQLANRAAVLLVKITNSYREVNLFAATSIVVIGVVIGGMVSSSHSTVTDATPSSGFAESQATQAHLFYRIEGRSALETNNEKQQQLLNWLSGRLGKEIRLIDFSEMGYKNIGLMLVPATSNFAMVTVYEDDQGQKLSLYIGLRDAGKTDDVACVARENTKSLCSWASDKLQFVVVSDLAINDTKQLAEWMQQNYAMAHLISSNEYFFSQTLGTIKA
ncbi:anti-sigma factor family protein [Kaarinaea lacus]